MDMRPIGIFDSGIGGISVLNELRQKFPSERFIYFGDNLYAPYGEKTEEEICERSEACARFLIDKGVKVIVIACNTASSAAKMQLRNEFSVPIIAMEPAVRPAAQVIKGDGCALVLATSATLKLPSYQALVRSLGKEMQFYGIPCPSFVTLVEQGKLSGDEVEDEIRAQLQPFRNKPVQAIVLGCTHFVHLRTIIEQQAQELFGDILVIDGNGGTANQLHRILSEQQLFAPAEGTGGTLFYTSGEEAIFLPRLRKLSK